MGIEYVMKENEYKDTALHAAVDNGSAYYENENVVQLLLDVFGQDKKKLIEYVMKENKYKYTALHRATHYGKAYNGNENVIKLLLDVFSQDKEQLIKYVMKEDKDKSTSLHWSAYNGNENVVQLLLDVFDQDKEQLIKYVMKEDKNKNTALHRAAENGNENVVQLLLNVFGKGDNEKLLEFLMKANNDKFISLDYALSDYTQEKRRKTTLRLIMKFAQTETNFELKLKYDTKNNLKELIDVFDFMDENKKVEIKNQLFQNRKQAFQSIINEKMLNNLRRYRE